MATFGSGFVRPHVYVKQTSGQGAPVLPPPFTAAFIGHGSNTMVVSTEVTRGSTATDIFSATHETASILSVVNKNTGVVYADSVTQGWTLTSAMGSHQSSLTWAGTAVPAEDAVYVVTYNAIKRPVLDYAPRSFTSLESQLAFSGVPSDDGSTVLNGTSIRNNISLAATIGKAQGMGQWWCSQLSPWDELSGSGYGISVSGTTPATTMTALALSLNINADGVQTITLSVNDTGPEIALDIQTKVRALTAVTPAKQAAFDGFTCQYIDNVYWLVSGASGTASAVVATGAAAVTLKLGAANGGTELANSSYIPLDLTSEAGLNTSVTQALNKLLLVEAYCLVPLFPMEASSGVNDSLITTIKAHIASARSILEQKWRVAIYGVQKDGDAYSATPETKYIDLATALGTDANIVVAPSTCSYAYGSTVFTIPGYGIASAIAGIVANPVYDPGEPISGKNLAGFDEIADPFNNVQKNLMGNAGVLMIDSELGVPSIIMDLTTNQANAVDSQLKFTKSKDYVSKSLRVILRKLYINTRNLGPSTLSAIAGTVRMVLQQMVWLNILNDFSDLVVTRNSIDARQVDIAVNIKLVPDVTWVYVSLGVNL